MTKVLLKKLVRMGRHNVAGSLPTFAIRHVLLGVTDRGDRQG
jgi:hypothetical protein